MIACRDDSDRVTTGVAAVDVGGQPALDELADRGQTGGQHEVPHPAVHVVEEHQAWVSRPKRREEGHAVPHLDGGVRRGGRGGAARAEPLGETGGAHHREDQVPPGGPADPVAARVFAPGGARRPGGGQGHVDAGLGPAFGDAGRVHLRAPGFGVVQVPPGDDLDAAETRLGGDVAELEGGGPGRRVVGLGGPERRVGGDGGDCGNGGDGELVVHGRAAAPAGGAGWVRRGSDPRSVQDLQAFQSPRINGRSTSA